MERFRVEVGWQDRIKPGHLVGAIANESGLDGRQIGKITSFDDYEFAWTDWSYYVLWQSTAVTMHE